MLSIMTKNMFSIMTSAREMMYATIHNHNLKCRQLNTNKPNKEKNNETAENA